MSDIIEPYTVVYSGLKPADFTQNSLRLIWTFTGRIETLAVYVQIVPTHTTSAPLGNIKITLQ